MKTKKKSYIKKKDVRIGNLYVAKISGKLAVIQVFSKRPELDHKGKPQSPGWLARNIKTKQIVNIKSHMKLRLDLNALGLKYDEAKANTGTASNRDGQAEGGAKKSHRGGSGEEGSQPA